MKKYVVDITTYKTKSLRLLGFRKPALVGLKVPDPMKVVTHSAFLEYKTKGNITPEVSRQVKQIYKEMRELQPERMPYIGRGYYVPGIEQPPGPRTCGIYSAEDYLRQLKVFYDFAINNGFDVEGSDIAVVLHPFIHPYKPPMQDKPEVPYAGGAVTPSREHKSVAVIEAIWGHDEAIQTLPHDTYLVDFESNIIIEKRIQQKVNALKATEGREYIKINIPPSHQSIQALDDLQILQIAKDYEKVIKKFGLHRMEFILQEEGILYRECTKFDFVELQQLDTEICGTVLTVKSSSDLQKIGVDNKIVSIHPKVIEERNMDVLTSLAVGVNHHLTILYPGSATTAHAATIFREQGHTLVFTRTQVFESGEEVEIRLTGNHLVAQRIPVPSKKEIYTTDEIDGNDLDKVGGKAFRLAEISLYDLNVPKMFVVSSDAFEHYILGKRVSQLLEKLTEVSSPKEVEDVSQRIQKLFQSKDMDQHLIDTIVQQLSKYKFKNVAVRSSANFEDDERCSFAGQFETFLNVNRRTIVEKVLKCWKSAYSNNVILYSLRNKLPLDKLRMAVIIQEMVVADKAGVVFTQGVNQNSRDNIQIEAVKGLGTGVVDGTGKTEIILVSKYKNKIQRKGNKILDDKEISSLLDTAKFIEKLYNKPQDIEWAYKKGLLYILQTRPITAVPAK